MIYLSDSDFTLYNCDVLEGLAQLEDESVHCRQANGAVVVA